MIHQILLVNAAQQAPPQETTMAIYKLIQDRSTPDRAYIVRGSSRVGTITRIKGEWHGRLRVANGEAITARGTDLNAVFDSIIDQRLAR
jgi:hypothetical protein